ncbi:MAG: site-specific DNA-methyltransferase [Candidatus Onthovivens sp.]|jgi:DNA modification methylase|nr:site-specific DNA-methyltransferase [Candidatus Onthovivens sp.]
MNIQKIKIDKLIPATYNPRKNLKPSDAEYVKIKNSIEKFGFVSPLVINKDMTVIGGHQRLKVLKEMGIVEVECIIVDLDKTNEKALNIALNKIQGDWDEEKLEALLQELKLEDFDTNLTGFDFDEVDEILKDVNGSKEDDFDVDSAYEEIEEPITKPGDVWILGKHRLMCGDSAQKEDVMRLMNNQDADMLLTDPPYNVDYVGKTSEALKIKNDNMSDNQFYEFLKKVFENMYSVTKEGASIYVFHADTEGLNFRKAFKDAGYKLAECLIWKKDCFVMGRQDYQWQHEPILYGWKEGAAHHFINDRTQSTILEFDRPRQSSLHPTMKPIDLVARLLKNSSKENDKILDLFGGSGSTIIAAEQLNRNCYTMELDPKYCDVIVKRWESLTNKEAILERR